MTVKYTDFNNDDIEQAFKARGSEGQRSPRSRAAPRFRTAAPAGQVPTDAGPDAASAAHTAAAAPEGDTSAAPDGEEGHGSGEHPDDTPAIPRWIQQQQPQAAPAAPAAPDAQATEPATETPPATPKASAPRSAGTGSVDREAIAAALAELLDEHEKQYIELGSKAAVETGKKLATILGSMSTEKISEKIIQGIGPAFFTTYIKPYLKWPVLIGIGFVLLLLAFCAFALGANYERVLLGGVVANEVTALHLDSTRSLRVRNAIGELVADNSPQILLALAHCSPDLGLAKAISKSGLQLCVGGDGARYGFRVTSSRLP